MTMRDPLRINKVRYGELPCKAFEVNGVPVDCVNVGLTVGFPDTCDLVLSGINNGPNLGFDVTYSGTVAGAMEGTINGIRSIAISMAPFTSDNPIEYQYAAIWLRDNWHDVLNVDLAELVFLNVNVPNHPPKGHRFVGMGKRVYKDRVEMREDPWGRPYYWQGGVAILNDSQPGTDVDAVRQGYVSVTPVSLDWTDHRMLERLRKSGF
jgi:5'-nucleotidase